MERIKIYYCPVNGWDCSYWKKDGTCGMVTEGLNPVEKCDDAANFYDPGDEIFMYRDPETGEEYEEPGEIPDGGDDPGDMNWRPE